MITHDSETTAAPLEIPPLETILSPDAREFTRLPPVGHATAARWLRSLCVLEILGEIEKGNGHRASRYRYKLPTT
jgi:hypothetical protein